MAKQVIKNYSFSASAKTVTLSDFSAGHPVILERLALITDTTTNQILYNFADSTVATATVSSNNVVTLSTLPGGAANSDTLRIDYNVVSGDPTYDSANLPSNAAQETGGNLATLAGAVTSAKVQTNTAQVSGTAVSVNNGTTDAGTQRVTLSSDSTGQVKLATGSNAVGSITNASFAATQATAANLNATVVGTGTFATQAAQSGTWNINNVSGTVSLPTGAATSAKQPALGTAGTASTDVLSVQGIASMTALKVDGSGTTQPVSGTITANAGTGNLGANITQISGSAVATAASGIIKTGVTDGSGNAITSTSNALDVNLKSGTTGLALDATLTGGTQQTKITDGTNVAGVLAPGTANSSGNAQLIAQTSLTATFSVTSASNGTAYDVGNYSWVSLQITSQYVGTSPTINFQGCNDNASWVNVELFSATTGSAVSSATSTAATGIFAGPLSCRYFRLTFTGAYTSGTAAGAIVFKTGSGVNTSSGVAANQQGTWTVQPGNTANSTAWLTTDAADKATGNTVPATAIYNGAQAKTALPTAASDGNIVGLTADKFGRLIVVPESVRDQKANIAVLTLTSTTSETTLIASAASTFNDITSIMVENTSATATEVVFKDSTAGTTQFYVYVPAGDMRGFSDCFFKQTTVNNNWTATCTTSVASIKISGTYVKNQ